MDDAGPMRGVQSRRDLHSERQCRADRKRPLQEPIREGLSVASSITRRCRPEISSKE